MRISAQPIRELESKRHDQTNLYVPCGVCGAMLTRPLDAHYTCATDTNQIKFVLGATQDILLQLHLRDCGLL